MRAKSDLAKALAKVPNDGLLVGIIVLSATVRFTAKTLLMRCTLWVLEKRGNDLRRLADRLRCTLLTNRIQRLPTDALAREEFRVHVLAHSPPCHHDD